MESNGKRKDHTCIEPGFFDHPRWTETKPGMKVGPPICARCFHASWRVYGRLFYVYPGLFKSPSREIKVLEK
jgi:hypothetical protein